MRAEYGPWQFKRTHKRYQIGDDYDPIERGVMLCVSNSWLALRIVWRGRQFAVEVEREVYTS